MTEDRSHHETHIPSPAGLAKQIEMAFFASHVVLRRGKGLFPPQVECGKLVGCVKELEVWLGAPDRGERLRYAINHQLKIEVSAQGIVTFSEDIDELHFQRTRHLSPKRRHGV